MDAPLLQVVSASAADFADEIAQTLGGALFSQQAGPGGRADAQHLAPAPGEGTLSAWHRALDAVQPGGVFVHAAGGLNPALLLDLRERGIAYAVFLHDYSPLCPTQQLWHRRQERCSGPGRTGWKCAWCVSAGWRRAAELPLRTLHFRHRPQNWRTALLRADALIADSCFAREFWVDQGAPPERIAVIPPWAALPAGVARAETEDVARIYFAPRPAPGSGFELLLAALDHVRRPLRIEVAGSAVTLPDAVPARHTIAFHGELGESGRRALLASCQALALPARWDPPYSRLAAEAQALGLPAVATAAGGVAEQIAHGVNGYLATPEDPSAFAESLQEALALAAPAWGGPLVAQNSAAEAERARGQIQRLWNYLREGENDTGLQLEHGAWLAQRPASEAATALEDLTRALRWAGGLGSGGAAVSEPAPEYRERAETITRHRRVGLNHAIAFFRACGCRRVFHLTGDGTSRADAVAALQRWGLESVAITELPDGIWADGVMTDSSMLRRRFPQARALVRFAPDAIESEAWLDGDTQAGRD